MKNNSLYLPGFHLSTLRRKPRSTAHKLADSLAHIRRHSISSLGECFGRFIPSKVLENGEAGSFSRRRGFSKTNTFWAVFSQLLDADGGCQEMALSAFSCAGVQRRMQCSDEISPSLVLLVVSEYVCFQGRTTWIEIICLVKKLYDTLVSELDNILFAFGQSSANRLKKIIHVTGFQRPLTSMKLWKTIRIQSVDFIIYLALPLVSVLLPASWSRALLARCSKLNWVLSTEADAAFTSASKYVATGDEKAWKARWKQVELLDVRDLYMMSLGRTRSVLDEIECDTDLEAAKDRVLIGMHWGPSISILKLFQVAGFNIAIPYRKPEREILRIRPFFYLFVSLAARYIVNVMGARAVQIGGAGKVLRAMIDQPGSVMVVMDAPPKAGRTILKAKVIGKNAIFDAGFPNILADNNKEYFFYALSLQPGGLDRKKLELMGPFSSSDAQEFVKQYAGFLNRHLVTDSTQWRIWHVAQQFWR